MAAHEKSVRMPDFIAPMLAVLVDEPFDNKEWLFEVKWDGFRALAFITPKEVELKSRNRLSFNHKFPEIVKELEAVRNRVILDGEIVAIDSKGVSHFQLLQNYQQKQGVLCYYVFDILYKDGKDLRDLPLIERKKILKEFLKQLSLPHIRYSDHILTKGIEFFHAAEKEHLEGIVGKKIDSPYLSKRSADWVKIKTILRQEVVICGFTDPKGSRSFFGALIAGVYEKGILRYVGHVGGGFDEETLQQVYKALKPLVIKKCPFENEPKVNMPVTWVKPKFLAEVSFAEWTQEGIMRQPIFQGLRMDKKAKSVKREEPQKGGLTHLDKIYWPKEKYTKGDLLAYYEKMAKYILPYLKGRPLVMHRFPEGIEGINFYQKDINFALPKGFQTVTLKQEGKDVRYFVVNDKKSLLFAVNLGNIELNPFLAHDAPGYNHPDYCVLDLDPHDISFDKVVEVALALHELLDEIKVKNYCKTSGSKGLHIMIPLHAKYDFEQSRQFAELVATIVHNRFPKTTSMERAPNKRPKRIYIDCLQNRLAQSIVAPYSVRPKPKATVSTPLEWDEVNKNLDITHYTIENVPARVSKKGDLLKPVLGPGMNLKAALKALQKYISSNGVSIFR